MTCRIVLIAGTLLALAGCALTPEARDALGDARAAYDAAQSNPHVARFAPGEAREAQEWLARLEARAQRGDADAAEVEHQGYLVEQQAHLARYRAMARAADAELARADEERTRLSAQLEQARAARAALAQEQAEVGRLNAEVEALRARLAAQQAREALRARMAALDARETERGWQLTLGGDALFDANQTTLKPDARRALWDLGRFLSQYPQHEVLVEGFTDSVGSEELNQALSQMRAQAVKDVLVEQGVARERIATRGLGEAYPVADNATAQGRERNRRVEILIPRPQRVSAGG